MKCRNKISMEFLEVALSNQLMRNVGGFERYKRIVLTPSLVYSAVNSSVWQVKRREDRRTSSALESQSFPCHRIQLDPMARDQQSTNHSSPSPHFLVKLKIVFENKTIFVNEPDPSQFHFAQSSAGAVKGTWATVCRRRCPQHEMQFNRMHSSHLRTFRRFVCQSISNHERQEQITILLIKHFKQWRLTECQMERTLHRYRIDVHTSTVSVYRFASSTSCASVVVRAKCHECIERAHKTKRWKLENHRKIIHSN